MKQRFYDFPLLFIGTQSPIKVQVPYPEDKYGIRFVVENDTQAYSHFETPYVYFVSRRPDNLDFKTPDLVPDWDKYQMMKAHSCARFLEFLPTIVSKNARTRLCAVDYMLHESDWDKGKPPEYWVLYKTDDWINQQLQFIEEQNLLNLTKQWDVELYNAV